MANLSVERIAEMLVDLDDYETDDRMTEWEHKFLDDLRDKLETNDDIKLSSKQIDSLEKIYNKFCKKPN